MNNLSNNRRNTKSFTRENITYCQYLMRLIGRTVMVEYNKSNPKEIIGRLINVGEDFIAVKPPCSPASIIVVNFDCINKITIIFEEK